MDIPQPEMVSIPAGTFVMGLPEFPQDAQIHWRWHSGETVPVRAFQLGKFAVTNAQYRAYVRATGAPAPSHIDQPGFNADNQPVGGISWEDATAYCHWLASATHKPYRLPTDAEFEYATRGNLPGKKFFIGDTLTPNDACYAGQPAPKPVGSFPPNAFGLYDMTGNVWQWCAERYEDVSNGIKAVNKPTGKDPAHNRVLRGGSFLTKDEIYLWAAYRHEDPPDLRHECLGFRVAL
jgi:formylglycine-generating enzyme required for sulfatase activity